VWSTEYTLTTAASPEALWRLLSDIDGWGAWNAGIEAIALDGPLDVGATFRMKPPGEDVLVSTVAELEPNRLLTDVTDLGELVIRVVHRLDPVAGGATAITYRVEVTGPAGDAMGEQVGSAVSADFAQVMAALAAAAGAAEAGHPQ
jgi:uncharacterized protein YndB with AHSA1/START domain